MKKVRENSLSKYYKSNNVFYIFVRRIRSLCLIPKDFINNTTLDVIFSPCESVFRTEHHTEYTSFKNYLMKEWLGTNSIHPIKEWNVSNIDIRTNNYCESLHRLINDFITSKVDVVGQIEIIEEIIKKDKKKTNSTPLFCGKKITNYINYIIKFLLKKLRNNKLDFLTYLDLVADAVQIQNLKEYEDFKSTHLMKRNFNNYAKSSILRFQKNGEYQEEPDEDDLMDDITVEDDNEEFNDSDIKDDDDEEELEDSTIDMDYPLCYYKPALDDEKRFSEEIRTSKDIKTIQLYSMDEEYIPFIDWCIEKSKGVIPIKRKILTDEKTIKNLEDQLEEMKNKISKLQTMVTEVENKKLSVAKEKKELEQKLHMLNETRENADK